MVNDVDLKVARRHAAAARLSRLTGVATLAILAGLVGTAPAERVKLKSGRVIEGHITDRSADGVTVKTASMELHLPMTQIEGIEEDNPAAVAERRGDEALQLDNLEAALAAYNEAKEKGGQARTIDAKIAEVQKRIEDREMARFAEPINRAQKLLDEKKFEEAAALLESIMPDLPPDGVAARKSMGMMADAHYQRSQALKDRVEYKEALAELKRSLELAPNRPKPYVELGELYALTSRTYGEALENFQKGLDLGKDILDPAEQLRIKFKMADICRQREEYPRAMLLYEEVHNANPHFDLRLDDLLVGMYFRVATDLQRSKPDKTIALLRKAIVIHPTERELHQLLSETLFNQDLLDEAIPAFRAWIAIDPKPFRAHHHLGDCLIRKGQNRDGRAEYEKEVELFPDNYEVLCNLGDITLGLEEYDKAKHYYETAEKLEPARPRAPLGLAKAARQLKDYTLARQTCQDVLALTPDDRDALFEMGRILRDLQEYEEAGTYFQDVVENLKASDDIKKPGGKQLLADAYIALGEVRLLTKGPGTAAGDFRNALTMVPEYPTAYYSMGQAYAKKYTSSKQLADLTEAEHNMLLARERDPKNPDYAIGLGTLYQQQLSVADPSKKAEYLQKAIASYREYIKLGGSDIPTVEGWIKECGG